MGSVVNVRGYVGFQSTLPAGEATEPRGVGVPEGVISIHASRGGSDHPVSAYWLKFANFNPRFPRGKRPRFRTCNFQHPYNFNPRFPRGKRHTGGSL